MSAAPNLVQRLAEVLARLDLVTDPELDEPITDMGFVEAVEIPDPAAGLVEVTFRLPTYWCSPNFAFLMAEGIKREVEALPWVSRALVRLQDHMAAEEMTAVVNAGGSFAEAFEGLHPGENLAELREKFDRKAFQRRQEVVIKALLAQGRSVASIVGLTLADLDAITFADPDAAHQKRRYREILGLKRLAPSPAAIALPAYDGSALTAEGFLAYMGLLRSVRINMEFSGSLCRGLKRSRYMEADLSGAAPVLVDFSPPDATQPGQVVVHTCR